MLVVLVDSGHRLLAGGGDAGRPGARRRRRREARERSGWRAARLALATAVVLGAVGAFAREPLAGLFTDDEDTDRARSGRSCCASRSRSPPCSSTSRSAARFRGAGDTLTPLVAAFVGNWVFRVPLAFLAASVFAARPGLDLAHADPRPRRARGLAPRELPAGKVDGRREAEALSRRRRPGRANVAALAGFLAAVPGCASQQLGTRRRSRLRAGIERGEYTVGDGAAPRDLVKPKPTTLPGGSPPRRVGVARLQVLRDRLRGGGGGGERGSGTRGEAGGEVPGGLVEFREARHPLRSARAGHSPRAAARRRASEPPDHFVVRSARWNQAMRVPAMS